MRHNAMIAPKIPPAARAENKQLQKLDPNKTEIESRANLLFEESVSLFTFLFLHAVVLFLQYEPVLKKVTVIL
jgi:hypothetical protein